MPALSLILRPSGTCEERLLLWSVIIEGKLAVLELREAKKVGRKPKVRRWAMRLDGQREESHRRFHLFKETAKVKKGEDEKYDVILNDKNRHDECECVGFLNNGTCAHIECLRALVANGAVAAPKRR